MGGATWKIMEMKKNVFFPTGNAISQLFKVYAKKFKKKGLIIQILLEGNLFLGESLTPNVKLVKCVACSS